MKCMLCGAVEEAAEIETGYTDPAKAAAAVAKVREQADRLGRWEHLQVTTTRAGGRLELLAGDVCPNEHLSPGGVTVAKGA